MAYLRRIEHRRAGSLISVLSERHDIGSASFTFTAQRGCGNADLTLAVEAGAGYVMERGDEVRFMWDNSTVWYSGFVSTRSRSEREFSQKYELRGFADLLASVFVDDDEEAVVHFGSNLPAGVTSPIGTATIESIVTWLWENRISPEFPELSLDVIQTTGQTVDHIQFDGSKTLFEILEELSNLASSESVPCYFGVDELKQFYFRRITSTSPQVLEIMNDEKGLTIEVEREDYGEIYNVLLLSGGLIDGNRLKARYSSASSIARYRKRMIRLTKDFLMSYADMARWASGFFAKYSLPFESMSIDQYVDEDDPVLLRPWMGYIKVTSPSGGLQRLTPFMQVDYQFDTTPQFSLSVSRLENELEGSSDGSTGDSQSEDSDSSTPIETPPTTDPDPDYDVVFDKSNIITSEDGQDDEVGVVLTQPPLGGITVALQGQSNVSSVEFTTEALAPQEVILEDVNGDGQVAIGFTLSYEPKEDVAIGLSGDSGIGISDPDLTFTSENYSTPQVVTFTGIPAGGTTTIEVSLGTTIDSEVTVDFAVSDRTEAVLALSGDYYNDQLVFDENNWDTPQYITATGIDDDGCVEFSLKLNTQPSPGVEISMVVEVTSGSTNPPYFVQQLHEFTFNEDNWDVEQKYTLVGVTEFDTAQANLYMMGDYPDEAATVILNVVDTGSEDTEINEESGPVNFTFVELDWSDTRVMNITSIPFNRKDGNVDYSVDAVVSSWDRRYHGTTKSIPAVNIDNDTPGITVSPNENLKTAEEGTTDQELRVVLNSQPTHFVDVFFTSTDTSSGIPDVASLRFETSNWDIPQTIVIEGQDDGIDGGTDKVYSVNLLSESEDPIYDALEIELPFTHEVKAQEGLTNIVADDPSGENNTEFVVGGVSTSFNDTYEPDTTDNNKLVATDRFAQKSVEKVFQPGTILNLVPNPESPQTSEVIVPLAHVFTDGYDVTVNIAWQTYDVVTAQTQSGVLTITDGTALGAGVEVFAGSNITMPPNVGILFLRAYVTKADDESNTIIASWPQDGNYLKWNVFTASEINPDPVVTAIAIPVVGIVAN